MAGWGKTAVVCWSTRVTGLSVCDAILDLMSQGEGPRVMLDQPQLCHSLAGASCPLGDVAGTLCLRGCPRSCRSYFLGLV